MGNGSIQRRLARLEQEFLPTTTQEGYTVAEWLADREIGGNTALAQHNRVEAAEALRLGETMGYYLTPTQEKLT